MSALDTSDKNPKQIASVANEQTTNLFDKLLDTNVPSENIETTCDTNKNCETCIILPNTIKSELSSQSDEIEGYTLGNHFTICNSSNLETNLNENFAGGSSYITKKRITKKRLTKKRRFRRNRGGGGNCMSNGTCDDKYNSNETPKTVADKPAMISLDGIMIIIVDLH